MTINKNELETSSEYDLLVGLAGKLKSLREENKLSIDQVATKLNLAPKVIKDIECSLEDIIELKTYSLVFLRGYLANYGKLVGLEDIENYKEFSQISIRKKRVNILTETTGIRPQQRKRRIVLKLFIVLLLITFTALAYNFLSDDTVSHRSSGEQESVEDVTPILEPDDKQEIIMHDKMEIISITNEETEPSVSVSVTAESPKVKPVAVKVAPVAPVESSKVKPVAVKVAPATSESPIAKPVVVNLPVTETVKTEKVKQDVEKEIVVLPSSSVLRFTFKADCWTEIHDAKGKRVAYGLYKKGRVMNVTGEAPFKVKLGDPTIVTMLQDGKIVSQKFEAGKVARFTLPL
jgi:cytoskeleton protein RodZ